LVRVRVRVRVRAGVWVRDRVRVEVRVEVRVRISGPRLGLAAQWREARALGLRLLRVGLG